MNPAEWNPRYLEYAKNHGYENDPDGMMARDRVHYPGGVMAGFIVWISGRWTTWKKLRGVTPNTPLVPALHEDFDAWLRQEPVRAVCLLCE